MKKKMGRKAKVTRKKKIDNGIIMVSRTIKSNMENGTAEDNKILIPVREFRVEPAKVASEYGMTINLGNFESATIRVYVQVPCYKEEIDEALEWTKDKCMSEIGKEIERIIPGKMKETLEANNG